jgi:hypothetical protein
MLTRNQIQAICSEYQLDPASAMIIDEADKGFDLADYATKSSTFHVGPATSEAELRAFLDDYVEELDAQ